MGYVVKRVRRSKSRRHKLIRRCLFPAALLVLLTGAGVAVWLQPPSGSSFSSSASLNSSWTYADPSQDLAFQAARVSLPKPVRPARPTYAYSVVPGGVHSREELQRAAEQDGVVAQHYSGFDYKKAQVVKLDQPKLVYLSYRMHDKIYWTRKKISLRKGEKIISDGKMSARTKCGNRISETAQPAVSPNEPALEQFEQPVAADGGTAAQAPFPGVFESALRTPPGFDGLGVGGSPLSSGYLYGPGGGGGFPPIFPPPLPCQGPSCTPNPPPPPPPPPPPVPEPGTIVMVATGVAGIYLRYRRK